MRRHHEDVEAKAQRTHQADVVTAGRTILICRSIDGSSAQSSVHYPDCEQDFRRCEDRRMSVATLISSPGFTLAQ
jgi:hypothetical protein